MSTLTIVTVPRIDPTTEEPNGFLASVLDEQGAQVGFAEGHTGYQAACEALATAPLPGGDE